MKLDEYDITAGVWWTVIIIAVLMLIFGCSKKVYIPFETKTTETVTIRDTTFKERLIPYRDSISVQDTSSFLSNPYAYSWVTWDNGILHHSLGIWPNAMLIVRVPYYMDRTKVIEIPKPYPKEVEVKIEKELTWWQKVTMWLGNIVILGSIGFGLIYLIYKWKR